MTDLFTPSEGAPKSVTAGDLWSWRMDNLAADYPAADFTLSYTLTPEAGGPPIAIPATGDADGYLVEVATTTTAGVAAGRHILVAVLTRQSDSARRTVSTSALVVGADPTTSEADTRSDNRRILDAITAKIEGRITKDAESYTIEGRSIARTPLEILHKLADRYRARVAREEGRSLVSVRKVKFT